MIFLLNPTRSIIMCNVTGGNSNAKENALKYNLKISLLSVEYPKRPRKFKYEIRNSMKKDSLWIRLLWSEYRIYILRIRVIMAMNADIKA